MDFVQEVIDALKASPSLGGGATLVAVRNQPVFDPAQLDTNGTFVSVLQADYRLLR